MSHLLALRAVIDGEATTLSVEDAKAIHADLWDTRGEIGRLRARVGTLDAENDSLVAQVLAEERHACVLALELATARELLRATIDGDARKYNPKGLRATVAEFLLASGSGS